MQFSSDEDGEDIHTRVKRGSRKSSQQQKSKSKKRKKDNTSPSGAHEPKKNNRSPSAASAAGTSKRQKTQPGAGHKRGASLSSTKVHVGEQVAVNRLHRSLANRPAPFEFGTITKLFPKTHAVDILWDAQPTNKNQRVGWHMVVVKEDGEKANEVYRQKMSSAAPKSNSKSKSKSVVKSTAVDSEFQLPTTRAELKTYFQAYGGSSISLGNQKELKVQDKAEHAIVLKKQQAEFTADIKELEEKIRQVTRAEEHVASIEEEKGKLKMFIVEEFQDCEGGIAKGLAEQLQSIQEVQKRHQEVCGEPLLVDLTVIASSIAAAIAHVTEKRKVADANVPVDLKPTPQAPAKHTAHPDTTAAPGAGVNGSGAGAAVGAIPTLAAPAAGGAPSATAAATPADPAAGGGPSVKVVAAVAAVAVGSALTSSEDGAEVVAHREQGGEEETNLATLAKPDQSDQALASEAN